MIFAILFILAFLLGLIVYLLSEKWWLAVGLSLALFLASTLADTQAQESWVFTLIFGLPIVFVGSLLGPYLVELRRGEELDDDADRLDTD